MRLCFFLANRATAYLFVSAGEADFFSVFDLDSGIFDSGLPVAVVLIFPLYFSLYLASAVNCRDKTVA